MLILTILAIPTILDGGNHTPAFEQAAATTAAHYACLDVSKALAATGVRVLLDDDFFAKVFALIFPHHCLYVYHIPRWVNTKLQVQQTFKEDELERGTI